MAIDSKNLLVAVKAFSRGNALPLDASEIYESLTAAQFYASQANAYEGQTIKVKNADGKYDTYVLQPQYDEEGNKTGLSPVLTVGASEVVIPEQTQFIQVVSSTASVNTQGILYVIFQNDGQTAKGYVYNGTSAIQVFEDTDLSSYATKDYVDGEIAKVINSAPETFDTLKEIADWIEGQTKVVYKKIGTEETISADAYAVLSADEKALYEKKEITASVPQLLTNIQENKAAVEAIESLVGELPADATSDTIVDYIAEAIEANAYDDSEVTGDIEDIKDILEGSAQTTGTLANQIATAKTAVQGDTTSTVADVEAVANAKYGQDEVEGAIANALGDTLAEGETFSDKVDTKISTAIGTLGTDEQGHDITVKDYVDTAVEGAKTAATAAINNLAGGDEDTNGGVKVSVTSAKGEITDVTVDASGLANLYDTKGAAATAETNANANTEARLGSLGTKTVEGETVNLTVEEAIAAAVTNAVSQATLKIVEF